MWYQELLSFSEGLPGLPAATSGAQGLADFLTGLIEVAGLKTKLDQCGVAKDRMPELATAATQQWTGTFNPRPLEVKDFEELYRCTYLDQKHK